MRSVGIFEGKTHFSQLVEAAESGETIVVTKHGKPVAQLGPVERKETFSEVVDRIRKLNLSLGMPIKDAIEEGRK